MELIDLISLELELKDSSNVELLESFIIRSYNRIRRYLNKKLTDDYIKSNYSDVVIELSIRMYRNRELKNNSKGIKSKTQGQRSVTYENIIEVFDDEIKSMLPPPYVGVM